MERMRTLTDAEIVTILGTSNCPNCRKFMPVHTEQTEEHLTTTSAACSTCGCTFAIDRTYPAPFEVLGGHEYPAK